MHGVEIHPSLQCRDCKIDRLASRIKRKIQGHGLNIWENQLMAEHIQKIPYDSTQDYQ